MKKQALGLITVVAVLTALTVSAGAYFMSQPKAPEDTVSKGSVKATTQVQPQQQQVVRNCDDDNIVGKVIGGAAGGVVGSKFGKGNGKTAATIGGSVGGTLLGEEYIPTKNVTCR